MQKLRVKRGSGCARSRGVLLKFSEEEATKTTNESDVRAHVGNLHEVLMEGCVVWNARG